MNIIRWVDQRKHWWKVFLVIFAVSVGVVGYIGYKTYEYAPPMCDFVTEQGQVVFSSQDITKGQQVFMARGLMDYGTYLGDGGLRGPDYTADALHRTGQFMQQFYHDKFKDMSEALRGTFVEALVKKELRENRYTPDPADPDNKRRGKVQLTSAQARAFEKLKVYYAQMFAGGTEEGRQLVAQLSDEYARKHGEILGELVVGVYASDIQDGQDQASVAEKERRARVSEASKSVKPITDADAIHNLAAFFFRGAWLSAAQRPGYDYSYTHNWPYDPLVGNIPHGGLVLWSVIGTLVVILALGIIFYYYGKMDRETVLEAQRAQMPPLATMELVNTFQPTPTQRATYKFFAFAAILFAIQVLAGLISIADYVGLFRPFGLEDGIRSLLPMPITRAWHTQMSIVWIAICWFAATIWILPLICRPEPRGQLRFVNFLYWLLVVVCLGGAMGIPLGVHGALKDSQLSRWMFIQGWEFMQIGRLYQFLLYGAFVLWLVIVVRGVWPALKQKQTWSLPNWMVYAIVGIIFMFSAGFVAGPETDFVIGDFWRWCTIHMWVEAFFELFTTIIVAYFLYLMGFVSHAVAARVVYLAAVLFLGSGLIGISHNFYWNAKSIETIALGGVLSSLQVAPLVLLTAEAWRFRYLPQTTTTQLKRKHGTHATFGLGEAFLFLIGVNFWNFLGAGVFGFMINLPIVNYYQHGTYLTINHAHAALFGVYGNLAIAAMLFCGRWNIPADLWRPKMLRFSFWAMNIGIGLMVVLDLFPVGIDQLANVMGEGYAYGRSQAYLSSEVFQRYTWLRAPGTILFLCGMVPVVWFMISRWRYLKDSQTQAEQYVVPPTVLACAAGLNGNGQVHGNVEETEAEPLEVG